MSYHPDLILKLTWTQSAERELMVNLDFLEKLFASRYFCSKWFFFFLSFNLSESIKKWERIFFLTDFVIIMIISHLYSWFFDLIFFFSSWVLEREMRWLSRMKINGFKLEENFFSSTKEKHYYQSSSDS